MQNRPYLLALVGQILFGFTLYGRNADILYYFRYVEGNADTRALTGEETGATNENDINSLEFFVFNSDGSFQKYYKPASVSLAPLLQDNSE